MVFVFGRTQLLGWTAMLNTTCLFTLLKARPHGAHCPASLLSRTLRHYDDFIVDILLAPSLPLYCHLFFVRPFNCLGVFA
jgi:hypothetical protein